MQPETCRSGIPESSILLATRLPTHEAAPLRNHVVHKRRVARRDDAHARCETSVKLQFPSLISFQWSTGPPCWFDSPRSSTDTSRQVETTRIDARSRIASSVWFSWTCQGSPALPASSSGPGEGSGPARSSWSDLSRHSTAVMPYAPVGFVILHGQEAGNQQVRRKTATSTASTRLPHQLQD